MIDLRHLSLQEAQAILQKLEDAEDGEMISMPNGEFLVEWAMIQSGDSFVMKLEGDSQ